MTALRFQMWGGGYHTNVSVLQGLGEVRKLKKKKNFVCAFVQHLLGCPLPLQFSLTIMTIKYVRLFND